VTEPGKTVRVQVPATSANLGPGFDTLGLALAYGDDLQVTACREPEVSVAVTGEGAGVVPADESHLVVRAIAHVFQRVNRQMPGLRLDATNRIPHGRGMGSSAAAIVSGITAAHGLLADELTLTRAELLEFATELEGHPDNVAPALYGGLTIAWMRDGVPRAKQLSVHSDIATLVLVPETEVSTKFARSLQPAKVPYEDAVFNLSRTALLIAALTQSPELLFEATEDRLHQDARKAAMPETHELVRQLRAGGHAATVSGAGPSVLVLSNSSEERKRARAFVAEVASNWRTLELDVDTEGARVVSV
jgi:homoserine kinase